MDQLREQLSQVRSTASNEYLYRLQTQEQLRSESARADSCAEQAERHEQRVREVEASVIKFKAEVVRLGAALVDARAEARQKDVEIAALAARLTTVGLSSATTIASYVKPS